MKPPLNLWILVWQTTYFQKSSRTRRASKATRVSSQFYKVPTEWRSWENSVLQEIVMVSVCLANQNLKSSNVFITSLGALYSCAEDVVLKRHRFFWIPLLLILFLITIIFFQCVALNCWEDDTSHNYDQSNDLELISWFVSFILDLG